MFAASVRLLHKGLFWRAFEYKSRQCAPRSPNRQLLRNVPPRHRPRPPCLLLSPCFATGVVWREPGHSLRTTPVAIRPVCGAPLGMFKVVHDGAGCSDKQLAENTDSLQLNRHHRLQRATPLKLLFQLAARFPLANSPSNSPLRGAPSPRPSSDWKTFRSRQPRHPSDSSLLLQYINHRQPCHPSDSSLPLQ